MTTIATLFPNIKWSKIALEYSFNFTYNLLRSSCEQTEMQIEAGIQSFKENGEDYEEIDFIEEEGLSIGVAHFGGLTDQDVDLKEIFTQYFPSLQRRSMYLTIFGVFEHELELFCKQHIKSTKGKIKLSDLRGNGVERANLYIEKVIGLKCKSYPLIEKLKELRNSCAHQDAKHSKADGQEIPKISQLVEEFPEELRKDDREVIFESGFLFIALDTFYAYFKEVEDFNREQRRA
ncbi:hypothetical protein [Photobacterium kishitanii]|uniref:Cthe-2314-like HEPN domain-containing protein n=1 Tax=Photobacterium kishitanii TaxID=318456 RepID=A0A2T3KJ54_9GAMM|nr:hypothetical protein [Photobacterium kishitanii]PSU99290.1 hypothetical protein C9J27_10030 [Photobacterium kishitanii]